jgi:hypothetical protein
MQAHLAFFKSLNQQLTDSGELVAVEGLIRPDQAKVTTKLLDAHSFDFPQARPARYCMPDVKSSFAGSRSVPFSTAVRGEEGEKGPP